MKLDLMKLLKIELVELEESAYFKRMVWAVACLLFFGVFRVHELLALRCDSFDPDFTLLHEDLIIHEAVENSVRYKSIQVLLKSPKENRIGNKVIVDVY